MIRDLALPTSRQKGDGPLSRLQTQPPQSRFARLRGASHFKQGMTHEGHRNPRLFVQRHFKREHHGHVINRPSDLLDSPRSPGPHLRANIVKHGDVEPFGQPSEAQIDLRKINQDQ